MKCALVVLAACGRIGFDGVPSVPPPDGGVQAHCGGPLAISDNFDDGATGYYWSTFMDDPSMTIAETGGQLAIQLADNVPGLKYAGYIDSRQTDLRGSRAFVEVTGVPDPATIGEGAFALTIDPMNDLAMSAEQGRLRAFERIAGIDMQLGEMPYDGAAQRWWQIREAGGTIYYEYSADGVAFTAFATTPTPSFAAHLRIQLYGGTYNATPAPGMVHFDNLNGGGATLEPWCKASSFHDDFSAGVVGPEWSRSYMTGACTLAETGGAGVVTLSGAALNNCAFATGPAFDLTGDAAFVSVKTTTNPAVAAFTFLDVVTEDDQDVFEIEQQMTDLICYEYIGATQTERCRMPYSQTLWSYWRIREQGGSIIWEVGPDGIAWTQMASVPEPYNFAAIKVELGAGTTGPTSSPGGAGFDSYNE